MSAPFATNSGPQGGTAQYVYRGTGEPHDGVDLLPPPPPWRDFDGEPVVDTPFVEYNRGELQRAESYQPHATAVELVNAALVLRRPLLVTGRPGSGKSTLAYSIAHELKLGPVLRWSITRSSTLAAGLYEYDAVGRSQEAGLYGVRQGTYPNRTPDVGEFVRLGPLGTALLPTRRPRVLLIDDFDQGDIDLPNELLTVLEEGEFHIPELTRISRTQPRVEVMTADGVPAPLHHGQVRCRAFPMVVITSNGDREFPPAFLRRCLHLELAPPSYEEVVSMVTAHLGADLTARSEDLIEKFLHHRELGNVSVDQLLNAIYLTASWAAPDPERLADVLLRSLEADDYR
ncbi:AAA family ATPase [Streptomyces sp. 7N604]|uniref:AAA family ATPase n=1 Tax=Streptomyces sp. 7N604 TaxID=3457415 RepID=UPI003FD5425B